MKLNKDNFILQQFHKKSKVVAEKDMEKEVVEVTYLM